MDAIIERELLDFLLYDWLAIERLAGRPRHAEHSRRSFDATLEAARQIAAREFASHHRLADREPPRLEDGQVILPAEVGRALQAFAASGFLAAAQDAEFGGAQLPVVVERACLALFAAANAATLAYPLLAMGNANLLRAHGTPAQIDTFARPQYAGRYLGTMCVSEDGPGSAPAGLRTRAVPDGASAWGPRYRLYGRKAWVAAGEHALADNIVHLVLARIAGDDPEPPAAAAGLSLFVVPRHLPLPGGGEGERNDVAVTGLNELLGLRGTVNVHLAFGESAFTPDGAGGAIGYLVGQAGQGLGILNHMANELRLAVGLGAAGIGHAGLRCALQYARAPWGGETAAGAVPLVVRPDVRRMLLAQKCYAEGSLALGLLYAAWLDEQRSGNAAEHAEATALLEILAPVVGSWPAEWCLAGNALAIQVMGGRGCTRDQPVEQHWRDNRLASILAGTSGMLAIDLLGRRVPARQGESFAVLVGRIERTLQVARAARQPDARRFATQLNDALQRVRDVTRMLGQRDGGHPDALLAHASGYLRALGHLTLGWIWLDMGLAASRGNGPGSERRRDGVWAACRYFYGYELPLVAAWLHPAEAGDRSTVDLDDAVL